FYATQDCDTRAEILIYNQQMGSAITHAFPPAITVYANDDSTNPSAIPIIKLMSGKPGSGSVATILKTVNDFTLNHTDISLADSNTAYYYADIDIAGKRTITAPIWYTRIDTGSIIINSVRSIVQSQ